MKLTNSGRGGILALDTVEPLFADGEEVAPGIIEREIGLTGEYKTRQFALARKQFEQVIENHKLSKVDPAVDRGHESITPDGAKEPAQGWVRELSIQPSKLMPNRDALVAKIELNDLGVSSIQKKHFRYLSMGIDLKGKDRMTGEPVGAVLDHLALVKRPFIEGMEPLSLSGALGAQENPKMKLALTALGLDTDANEAEALAAVTALKDFERNVLALSGKPSRGEALGALTGIAAKAERSDKVEAELVALKAAAVVAEVSSLLDEATKDGRVPPAKRAEMVSLAETAGIAGLKACLSMLTKKVMTAGESPVEVKDASVEAFSALEIEVAKAFVGDDKIAIAKRIEETRALNATFAKIDRIAQ